MAEIVKEDERATRMAKFDDDDDDDDGELLNASQHSVSSLDFSTHSDFGLSRSSHGDALNRSTHSDINASVHGEDWLDEFLDMDPLAEVYFNEIIATDPNSPLNNMSSDNLLSTTSNPNSMNGRQLMTFVPQQVPFASQQLPLPNPDPMPRIPTPQGSNAVSPTYQQASPEYQQSSPVYQNSSPVYQQSSPVHPMSPAHLQSSSGYQQSSSLQPTSPAHQYSSPTHTQASPVRSQADAIDQVPSPATQEASVVYQQPVLVDPLTSQHNRFQTHYPTCCIPDQNTVSSHQRVMNALNEPSIASRQCSDTPSLNRSSAQNVVQADPLLDEVLGVELSSFDFDGLEDVISWTPSFNNSKS